MALLKRGFLLVYEVGDTLLAQKRRPLPQRHLPREEVAFPQGKVTGTTGIFLVFALFMKKA